MTIVAIQLRLVQFGGKGLGGFQEILEDRKKKDIQKRKSIPNNASTLYQGNQVFPQFVFDYHDNTKIFLVNFQKKTIQSLSRHSKTYEQTDL